MIRGISIRTMVILAIVVTSAQCVQADLITFIHEGRGEATLDGVNLGVVDFTITAYGDTDDREDWYGDTDTWQTPHTSASITIGRAKYDFLQPTRTWVSHWPWMTESQIGFGLYGDPAAGYFPDLFIGPAADESWLHDWNMLTSLGPVTGEGNLLQWVPPVETTIGGLHFEGTYPATFTAEIIPEPTTLLLLGLGAAMVRRKR